MFYPYKMMPVFKDSIWGGHNLKRLGKSVPQCRVAESWELSAMPGNETRIANGVLKGWSICDVISKYGKQVIGEKAVANIPNRNLPVLLKYIDANDRLSVQVHPDNTYAMQYENGQLGKTEMWYIIGAKPSASVIHGFSEGCSHDEIREAILENRHGGLYREVHVKEGDVVFVPAGTVHALNDGLVVAEIQQHSDLTYRLFDYDRLDFAGQKRPLHINKALDVLDYNNHKPLYRGLPVSYDNARAKYLAISEYFCVILLEGNGAPIEFVGNGSFSAFMFINGEAEIISDTENVQAGALETVFIPACMGRYRIEGEFLALRIFVPDSLPDVITSLREKGFSNEDIVENVAGIANISCLS